jgi:hypothetical protein
VAFQVEERDQNEGSLMHSWMRDGEYRGIENGVRLKKEDIEVDNARTETNIARMSGWETPKRGFDRFDEFEELKRGERCLNENNGI